MFSKLKGYRPNVFGKETTDISANRNSNSNLRFSSLHENPPKTSNSSKWVRPSSIIPKSFNLFKKLCTKNDPIFELNIKEITAFKEYFTSIENNNSRSQLDVLLVLISGYISNNFSSTRGDKILHQLNKLSYHYVNSKVTWEEFINILKKQTKIKVPPATRYDTPSFPARDAYVQFLSSKTNEIDNSYQFFNQVVTTSNFNYSQYLNESKTTIDKDDLINKIKFDSKAISKIDNKDEESMTIDAITEFDSAPGDFDERMTTISDDEKEIRQEEDVYDDGDDVEGDDTYQANINKLLVSRSSMLSQEESNKVTQILNGPDSDKVLILKFNVDITARKMKCLKPSTWLNDEMINFYMQMLLERNEKLHELDPSFPRSHFFSSHFISKMLEDGQYIYSKIKRWSKKFDIFCLNKIFCPVNISNSHWTLAVVFMDAQEIHYYDSMSGRGKKYLDSLLQWVIDEGKEKKNITIDASQWKLISQEGHVPQQQNGTDCGAFATICADYLSEDLPLLYSQAVIPLFRRKMAAAILRGSLNYPFKDEI